jgi:superfamily II DNA/RNA helicase
MQAFTLDALPLDSRTQATLAKEGITAPTPIQLAACPPIVAGRDTVVRATVGTGKTLAYLLPLLGQFAQQPKTRLLIMAPTPELAVQILRVVELYKPLGTSSLGLIGGANLERQKDKLKKHPAILVGTPGRILDLVASRKIKLATVTAVVLDESDEILASQHHDAIVQLLQDAAHAQKICVSATFGPGLRYLTDHILENYAKAEAGDTLLSPTIRHLSVRYDPRRKDISLLQLLADHRIERALLFVNKRPYVPHLYRFLNEHDVPCVGLSAERDKRSRQEAMEAFRKGRARVLVATDAAARGIDVKDLPWVIHYEPARDVDTYVHRAGRTGRAGRAGTSVTMVAPEEMHLLRRYSRALAITFDRPGSAQA